MQGAVPQGAALCLDLHRAGRSASTLYFSPFKQLSPPMVRHWPLVPLLSLLLGLWAGAASGQYGGHRLFSTADGLADRMVTDLHRDAHGFLWILGPSGLQRYDGNTFRSYPQLIPDSLAGTFRGTQDFHVDPEGHLWLVGRDARAALKIDLVACRSQVVPAPFLLPTGNGPGCWDSAFLLQYDFMQPLLAIPAAAATLDSLRREMTIVAVGRTDDGAIWLHDWNGRSVRWDPITKKLSVPLPAGGSTNPLFTNALDGQGRLWAVRPDGKLVACQVADPDSKAVRFLPFFDRNSNPWLVSTEDRLYSVDPVTGHVEDHGAVPRSVHGVLRDHEGIIWVATEGGLVRISPAARLFHAVGSTLHNGTPATLGSSARGIVQLADRSFLGFNDHGHLLIIPAQGGPVKEIMLHDQGGELLIKALLPTPGHGSLLVANGGLYALAPGTWNPTRIRTPFAVPISACAADNDLVLFFLEDGQATLYNAHTNTFGPRFPLSKPPLSAVLLRGRHVILPAPHGLRIHDMDTHRERTVDLGKDGPQDPSTVRSMAILGPDLWIATANGLLRVDTSCTRPPRRIGIAEGLADEMVYSLLPDGGRLWAGTRDGLSLVQAESGATTNFDMRDGLPFMEFNAGAVLRDDSGHCWMGGINGFARFRPGEVAALQRPPAQLRLSSVRNYNADAQAWNDLPTEMQDTEMVRLEPRARTLAITFMLASFEEPESNRFSYYMDGLEPAWFHVGTLPDAEYLDLPPGHYTFRVKAFDHRGNQAANEIALPVTVMQVWYARRWAIVLWAVLAIAALALGARLLLHRRMEQAEARRIRELDRFKDRFFANVTHEFRTPLTVMMGLAGQLESGEGPGLAETHRKAGTIRRNGQRLLALMEQVMDLTRLQNGKLQLRASPVAPLAFLERAAAPHRAVAEARGIRFRWTSNGQDRTVLADAERLRQVMDNLLANALKFTPAGGSVHVAAELGPGAPAPFRLTVEDNGPGIPDGELQAVFERFHQTGQGAEVGGTGIGLALVKELVEAMHGSVTADHVTDGGACFTVELPLETTEAAAEAPAAPVADPERQAPDATAPPDGQRPLLLLVEDDADVGDYIAECVSGAYQLLRAMDGTQGLAMATEQVPDLVLSDVMMPGMDGFTLCAALKADPRTSHIPVALLTAKDDRPSRLEGITKGADAYLVKPFDAEELRAVLHNLLLLRQNIVQHYQAVWANSTISAAPLSTRPAMSLAEAGRSPIPEDIEHVFLARVRRILEQRYADTDLGVEQLAEALHLSRSQVLRKIRALTGSTPVALIRDFRLAKADLLLAQGGRTVAEVAYDCGFSTPNYFSDVYLQARGRRPSSVGKD